MAKVLRGRLCPQCGHEIEGDGKVTGDGYRCCSEGCAEAFVWEDTAAKLEPAAVVED